MEAGGSCKCSVCLLFQENENASDLTAGAGKSRSQDIHVDRRLRVNR